MWVSNSDTAEGRVTALPYCMHGSRFQRYARVFWCHCVKFGQTRQTRQASAFGIHDADKCGVVGATLLLSHTLCHGSLMSTTKRHSRFSWLLPWTKPGPAM